LHSRPAPRASGNPGGGGMDGHKMHPGLDFRQRGLVRGIALEDVATVRRQNGQKFSIGGEGRSPKIFASRQSRGRPEVKRAGNGDGLDWPTPHTRQTTEEKVLPWGVE